MTNSFNIIFISSLFFFFTFISRSSSHSIFFNINNESEVEEELEYHAKWGPRTIPLYSYPPPVYTIDLDGNYTQKWLQIIQDKGENLTKLINYTFNTYHIPAILNDLPTYSWIYEYNPNIAEECQAIADLLGVHVSIVFMLNLMYESTAFCTSLIAQSSNGKIIHGRNLDYSLAELMGGISFNANYYRNGSLVYRANGMAGFIGVITGEKPNAFGISANQRDTLNESHITNWIIGLSDNLIHLIFEKKLSMTYVIRQAFEEMNTYEDVVQMLSNTPIIAPVYYIVSGTKSNEGCVITMNRDTLANITTLDVENNQWYLVQTNYDRDIPDPPTDNRRTAAQNRLEAIGQDNVNVDNIMGDVLSRYPNFNKETLLSSVFVPIDDYFNTTLWY